MGGGCHFGYRRVGLAKGSTAKEVADTETSCLAKCECQFLVTKCK